MSTAHAAAALVNWKHDDAVAIADSLHTRRQVHRRVAVISQHIVRCTSPGGVICCYGALTQHAQRHNLHGAVISICAREFVSPDSKTLHNHAVLRPHTSDAFDLQAATQPVGLLRS